MHVALWRKTSQELQKLPYTSKHLDHLEDDDHLDHDELMIIKLVRKLEVVHHTASESVLRVKSSAKILD